MKSQFTLHPCQGLGDEAIADPNKVAIARQLYFTVCVFGDKTEMLDYAADRLYCTDLDDSIGAMVHPYTRETVHKDGSTTVLPDLGYILFYVGYLTTEVLAHESTHAAMAAIRHLSDRGFTEWDEELLAYMIGGMTQELVNKVCDLIEEPYQKP